MYNRSFYQVQSNKRRSSTTRPACDKVQEEMSMEQYRFPRMVAKHGTQGPKREIVQLRLHKTNLQDWQESTKDYFKEHGAIHLLYSLYSKRAPAAETASSIVEGLTQELGRKAVEKAKRKKDREQDLRWTSDEDEQSDDEDYVIKQEEDDDWDEERNQGDIDEEKEAEDGDARAAKQKSRERAAWRKGLNAVEKRIASGMIEYIAHEGKNKGGVEGEDAAKLRAKCYKQLRRSLDLFPQ